MSRIITLFILFAVAETCVYADTIFEGTAEDVTKKSQTISFASVDSRVYGDSSFTLGSETTDQNLTISYTASDMSIVRIEGNIATILKAGTAQITASQAGNDSIFAAKSVVRTFTVYPKVITVKADSKQSKVYGQNDPVLTYSVSENLIGDDTFRGNMLRDVGENVGVYTIRVGSLTAGSNYSISFEESMFSINKKQLKVKDLKVTTKKTYDGTPNANVTVGMPIDVGNDEIIVTASAKYDNANVGQGKHITVSYAISGSESGNYIAPSSVSLTNGVILALPLSISVPDLNTVKIYDGNTSVEIKSLGGLSGVLPGDTDDVTIEGIASYDTASPGLEKSITVTYTLLGDAAINYSQPVPYVLEDGKILEEIKVTDNQLSVPAMGGCRGEELLVSFDLESGMPVEYTIEFNEFAKSNGFEDITGSTIGLENSTNTIEIPVPTGAEPGVIEAEITFFNELGVKTQPYTVAFPVNLDKAFIVKKFDDVLVADNSSKRFSEYQWYKDGEAINGATGQFYNDPEGISGSYFLDVITNEGELLRTCPQLYEDVDTRNASLSVYPNPVVSDQGVTVRFDQITDLDLEGAILSVYTINGALVHKTDDVNQSNTIFLPAGSFVGTVNTKAGQQYVFKITAVD